MKKFRLIGSYADKEFDLAAGTTIGNQRILRFPITPVDSLALVIEDARAAPTIAEFEIY